VKQRVGAIDAACFDQHLECFEGLETEHCVRLTVPENRVKSMTRLFPAIR